MKLLHVLPLTVKRKVKKYLKSTSLYLFPTHAIPRSSNFIISELTGHNLSHCSWMQTTYTWKNCHRKSLWGDIYRAFLFSLRFCMVVLYQFLYSNDFQSARHNSIFSVISDHTKGNNVTDTETYSFGKIYNPEGQMYFCINIERELFSFRHPTLAYFLC